jgi:hypothetical protein
VRAIAEHLGERGGKVLGVAGGAAAAAGTHQDAISIIPVSGAVVLSEAVERVVGVGVRTVAQQVAGGVVLPADDVVGGEKRKGACCLIQHTPLTCSVFIFLSTRQVCDPRSTLVFGTKTWFEPT